MNRIVSNPFRLQNKRKDIFPDLKQGCRMLKNLFRKKNHDFNKFLLTIYIGK